MYLENSFQIYQLTSSIIFYNHSVAAVKVFIYNEICFSILFGKKLMKKIAVVHEKGRQEIFHKNPNIMYNLFILFITYLK